MSGERLGHLGAGAVPGAQEQDPDALLELPGRERDEPQARVQRRSGSRQKFSATRQFDPVISIAAVSGAAPHRHQPAGPELAEVV
jgi:hypothetical protein